MNLEILKQIGFGGFKNLEARSNNPSLANLNEFEDNQNKCQKCFQRGNPINQNPAELNGQPPFVEIACAYEKLLPNQGEGKYTLIQDNQTIFVFYHADLEDELINSTFVGCSGTIVTRHYQGVPTLKEVHSNFPDLHPAS